MQRRLLVALGLCVSNIIYAMQSPRDEKPSKSLEILKQFQQGKLDVSRLAEVINTRAVEYDVRDKKGNTFLHAVMNRDGTQEDRKLAFQLLHAGLALYVSNNDNVRPIDIAHQRMRDLLPKKKSKQSKQEKFDRYKEFLGACEYEQNSYDAQQDKEKLDINQCYKTHKRRLTPDASLLFLPNAPPQTINEKKVVTNQ